MFKVKFKILLPSKLPTYVCILSVLCTYLPNYFTNYLVHRYLLPRLIIDDYMSLLNLFEIPKINSNCALRLNASSYSAQNIIEKMDFDQMSKVNYVRSLGGRGFVKTWNFVTRGRRHYDLTREKIILGFLQCQIITPFYNLSQKRCSHLECYFRRSVPKHFLSTVFQYTCQKKVNQIRLFLKCFVYF